ncbi:MucR family transcriptional regulator [Humidesulfovibrio idahonensis]
MVVLTITLKNHVKWRYGSIYQYNAHMEKEILMDDYLKEALEIVKAQASVRTMTEEEITSMVKKLVRGIQAIAGEVPVQSLDEEATCEPSKCVREKTITCCVCGKAFKIITKKHLLSHSLTPNEYREKFGYKKGMPLVCKSLQRDRRKKMKEMELWKKRGAKK